MKHIILALIIFSILFSGIGQANTIEVQDLTGSLTAEDLVNILLGENSTVVVSNITITGSNTAIGKFTSGGSLGFDTGIVMSSGAVSDVPNDMTEWTASTDNSELGDSDLNALVSGTTYDAVVIEFDFVPEKSGISFNYLFGSEESFLDDFDDAFGLFVNGENVALLPDGNPVSIFNIREGPYYQPGPLNNCFNGFSIVLTATAEVEPGTLNHMKFAIADMSDAIVDAVVFIEGGSFTSNNIPDAPASPHCESETNPTNVADLNPEFSWTFSDPDIGDTQSAYQIQVGTSESESDIWDSGKILNISSTDISYAGSDLELNTTYYWRVRTWDNNNAAGPYCDVQTFTTTGSEGPIPLPVADFTANVTSGAVPLTITFTDGSSNEPTNWAWDFGDGNTSTDQDPIYIYTSVGTYTVSLNTTNAGGYNITTKVDYILVTVPAPVADFTADVTSGAVPLAVNFTDQSTNTPTSWLWNFGDGANSTEQNPTHIYDSAGTYTVSLNATNVGGSNISTQTDYITAAVAPITSFTADVTSGAVPLSVNFADQSTNTPTSWLWNFGDGANSTEQNPTHTYASAGTYTVSLNATNVGGSNTSIQTDHITAAITPVAGFTSDVTSGAVPLSVNFTDQSSNSPTSWFWDFGDGINSTEQDPNHVYTSVGIYNVSLNVTNAGGSNTSMQTAYITAAYVPVANFTADVTSGAVPLSVNFTDLSSNNPISWLWDFGDGDNSTDQHPIHTYAGAGIYNVSLNVTNMGGSNILIQAAYINAAVAPVANFTADVTSGTAPLAVYFADQSTNTPTSWAWNFGDGTTSTEQDPAHTYTSAGTYNVSLNAANAGGSNVSTQAGYITVTSGSSGGSDSGRRTSVSPGQPPESTTSTYTAVKHVMGGTSIEYDLSGTGSPVLGISFDAKDNEGAVVAKVQALSDSPEGITNPPGNPYQMMSIDVGSQGTISSHNADNIMINFRVSWEWIRENNIDPATIRMTRYHDGEWQELPTGRVSDDGEYLYFAAETTGFSIFSIVGDKLVLATEGEANVPQAFTEEATEVPASTEDKSTPGFTAEIGLVFLSLAFLADRKYGR